MGQNFYETTVPHLMTERTRSLINEKGQERIRKMRTVTTRQPNGIGRHVLLRFVFPGDSQGTEYMELEHDEGDDEMWIDLPTLKNIAVDSELSVEQGHAIAHEARHELLHHLRYLSNALIHVDPLSASGEAHHRISQHEHNEVATHSH